MQPQFDIVMQTMRRLFFLMLFGIAACTYAPAGEEMLPASHVHISDLDHNPVLTLSTTKQLEVFNRLWLEKKDTGTTTANMGIERFQYFLDVKTGSGKSKRWLYATDGVVARLDPKAQVLYQVSAPGAFNSMLGAKK